MKFVPSNDYMVCMAISDYFFNTAVFAYQESGSLKMTLGSRMVSSVADCEHRRTRTPKSPADLGGRFHPQGRESKVPWGSGVMEP